jgi:hypothetical protein
MCPIRGEDRGGADLQACVDSGNCIGLQPLSDLTSLGDTRVTSSIIVTMQPVPKSGYRRVLFVLCTIMGFALCLAAKDFIKPAAQPAKTYPAHDDHTDEKVAIAADPYDTGDKSKIFSVNFHEHGLLPVFLVVTNDGSQPISIANMQVTLTTANRSKLTPITTEDIYRRLTNPRANTDPTPLPIPLPHKKVKGTISPKEKDEIESSRFAARAVEPHTTQSGFLFFDVEDIDAPLTGAHIYVTGVNDAKGTELMYFEIPMGK